MTAEALIPSRCDDPLAELEKIALDLGAPEIGSDARALAARVAEGLFYVACVGQFKRGKSTLLNALIGRPLLPAGVVPVTAVITIVRHGPDTRAVVHFDDGHHLPIDPAMLADYIAEERNPHNEKRVTAVEVFTPSDLLSSGMCLVDTPGLGSIFRQNTETTRAFLPHIDAALVVLGADPPIAGEEAAIVGEIARDAPHLVFVLNKADRLTGRDVAEAATFTRNALRARLDRDIRLFIVSAIEPGTRDWRELMTALTTLAREAGADLVRSAQQRGQRRIAERLLREIESQRDALTRPVAETERRVTSLQETIAGARRALGDLTYLLLGEEHRLSREFDEERKRFLDATMNVAVTRLEEVASSRDDLFRRAGEIAEESITKWMRDVEPRAEEFYARSTERFVAIARDFLRRAGIGEELDVEQHFRKRRGFYFTHLMTLTGRPPGASILDVIGTAKQRRARALRDGAAYLRRLLESNSARVANDLRDRVLESRRLLEQEIRSTLDRAASSAERALALARAAQQEGASAARRDLIRLDAARARLRDLSER
ncbi:MAG TPA: dynamin family protein [Thermoanaerobaculia bacterium]|nr:dynamin family protein [Thermoanaerobaculia bacterium]